MPNTGVEPVRLSAIGFKPIVYYQFHQLGKSNINKSLHQEYMRLISTSASSPRISIIIMYSPAGGIQTPDQGGRSSWLYSLSYGRFNCTPTKNQTLTHGLEVRAVNPSPGVLCTIIKYQLLLLFLFLLDYPSN